MRGFFSHSKLITKNTVPLVSRCGLCGLYKTCHSPKMAPTGKGLKKILIVADAPGEREDLQGIQLIGDSGKRLEGTLKKLGIDFWKDCWRTNAVICHPPKNETPSEDKIIACQPNLLKTIKELKPNVVILLGGIAVKSLLSVAWNVKEVEGIGTWAGFIIPCQNPNAWIIPTYHPSYLLRVNNPVLDRMFENHLSQAIKKSNRKPWKELPDYEKQVEIIIRPHQAKKAIQKVTRKGGMIAFDYETNCLKPEGEGPRIFSCSICHNGTRTFAYPWHGEAVEATSELLRSSIQKIASNLKFEDRWTRSCLKHSVKNWLWDTMIAAHVLDNRPNITGIKFQSFVQLGAKSYNEHIEPFLKSKNNNKFNRIQEIDLDDLLLYNGLDSLYEYKVAMKQIKLFEQRSLYARI